MPMYVSPEQLMKDRADFARKGIGRGRPVIAMNSRDGIFFVGVNRSRALNKIAEIYDRIAFAAVGKYNEFENLRVAGVRYADIRGYSYARQDVTGRGLANAYAQSLGTVFTTESKPLEVEILVAELGSEMESDVLYRISFDGSVSEEANIAVMGAGAAELTAYLRERWNPDLSAQDLVKLGIAALQSQQQTQLDPSDLETGFLDRSRSKRTFRRLNVNELGECLAESSENPETPQNPGLDPKDDLN